MSRSVSPKVDLPRLLAGVTTDGLVVLSGTLLPLPALHTLTLAAKPGTHLEMQHCSSVPPPSCNAQLCFSLLQLPNTKYQVDLTQLCYNRIRRGCFFFLGLSTKTKEPLEILTAPHCLVSLTAEGLNMLAWSRGCEVCVWERVRACVCCVRAVLPCAAIPGLPAVER